MVKLPKSISPTPLGEFALNGEVFQVVQTTYESTGRLALLIRREFQVYSRLSVNVPGCDLAANEFLAKTVDENEELRGPLLETGLFHDTGERIPAGFLVLERWQLRGEVVASVA